MFTKAFLNAALERAIKTFAQALGAAAIAAGTGLLNTDWKSLLSVAGMAAVLSLCTSFGSGAFTGGDPSLATEVIGNNGAQYGDEPDGGIAPPDVLPDGTVAPDLPVAGEGNALPASPEPAALPAPADQAPVQGS